MAQANAQPSDQGPDTSNLTTSLGPDNSSIDLSNLASAAPVTQPQTPQDAIDTAASSAGQPVEIPTGGLNAVSPAAQSQAPTEEPPAAQEPATPDQTPAQQAPASTPAAITAGGGLGAIAQMLKPAVTGAARSALMPKAPVRAPVRKSPLQQVSAAQLAQMKKTPAKAAPAQHVDVSNLTPITNISSLSQLLAGKKG